MSQRSGAFSLRSVVSPRGGKNLSETASVNSVQSTGHVPGSGLKFDFGSVTKNETKSPAERATPVANVRDFTMTMKGAGNTTKSTSTPEVMKLAAVVEDLKMQCKNAKHDISMKETQLSRAKVLHFADMEATRTRYNSVVAKLETAKKNESTLTTRLEAARMEKNDEKMKLQAAVADSLSKTDEIAALEARVMEMQAEVADSLSKADEIAALEARVMEMQAEVANVTTELESAVTEKVALRGELVKLQENQQRADNDQNRVTPALESSVAANLDTNGEDSKERMEMRSLESRLSASQAEVANVTKTLESIVMEKVSMREQLSKLQEKHESVVDDLTKATTARESAEHERDALERAAAEGVGLYKEEFLKDAVQMATKETVSTIRNALTDDIASPVRMHDLYETLRTEVLALSRRLEQAEQAGCSTQKVDEIRRSRDAAYLKAVITKRSYEEIFGTCGSSYAENLQHSEQHPDRSEPLHKRKHATTTTYVLCDDPPVSTCNYGRSLAHKLVSSGVPMNAAVNQTLHDCRVNIGSELFDPDNTTEGSTMCEEPLGNHDQKDDMVSAVVEDLTNFLKYANGTSKETEDGLSF